LADLLPGDVIVFESDKAGLRLLKRVIAVPGDVISMRDKRVMINGEEIEYGIPEESGALVKNNFLVLQELIENKPHRIQINPHSPNFQGDFSSMIIPENNYFVLGDKRDNSRDSRYIGLVPRHEIIGRSRKILLSLDYDNYYLPRLNRFNFPLQ